MSADRVTYLDSSAIVKLVVAETESDALRRAIRRTPVCMTSALARTEVHRAVLSLGPSVGRRADDVLRRIDIVRVSDRVLADAGALMPPGLRPLDAIHLATALLLGDGLIRVLTYDTRLATAARELGIRVAAPT